jgi:hypothetical protein
VRVLLLQLDGKLPNLALMRLSAHHKAQGDEVTFRRVMNASAVERHLWEPDFDRVYASLIFEWTRPLAERVREAYPNAVFGGTGWDLAATLEDIGVTTAEHDYTLYPKYRHSIGFSQRGCRLKCGFCVVPRKEGAVRETATIAELWRGDPYPRELVLLDNDFFGQPSWRERIEELRAGDFKVSFNQGINARMLNDESAAAIASVRYYEDSFRVRRVYTAWDSVGDERPLMRGLNALARHGVKPDHIMVYMLIGYGADDSLDGWEYRRAKLREFGARPYPMTFARTREAVGFQRWVIGAYDKRVSWQEWLRADYEPRRLGFSTPLLDEVGA